MMMIGDDDCWLDDEDRDEMSVPMSMEALQAKLVPLKTTLEQPFTHM